MTFSLVARCTETGMLGVAVSSSSPAVAARCSHARAGIGAVATQNVTDPSLGPRVLDLLEKGKNSAEVIVEIQNTTKHMEFRQLLVVDKFGNTDIHSGSNTLGIWAEAKAENVASGGNLLAKKSVPQMMVDNFVNSKGHLGDRLIGALYAGLDAGGEAGPIHSSGLMVVDKVGWPIVDLRCDWTDDSPIATLDSTWQVYKPQMDAYVQRAIDPDSAPSFGVPGDD